MKRFITVLVLFTLLFTVEAANAGHFSLKNKSMLELQLSGRDYRNNDFESVFYQRDSFDKAKFSIGIVSWTSENSALTFSVGASEINTDIYYDDYGILNTKSTLVPIFFGTRMYMTDRNGIMPIKPYIALAGGPVLGVNNYIDDGEFVYFEDDVFLTFGGYIGGGVDVMFGQQTTIGLQAGYNFYADFDRIIGDRQNFSGAELGISVGFLFGNNNHHSKKHSKQKHKKRVRKF